MVKIISVNDAEVCGSEISVCQIQADTFCFYPVRYFTASIGRDENYRCLS